MKLLIVCQALDKKHPILGFFHRWVEEFAQHADAVVVIASAVGEHALPANVAVHSLRKEAGVGSVGRVLNFYRLIVSLRNEYNAVFVHMIPEFVIAGGLIWKLFGKKMGLWYVHGSVSVRLRIAEMLADYIFTTSPESFRLKSNKVHMLGHGIDTDFFTPDPSIPREKHWLSAGRLMKSKRHDLVIREAHETNTPLRVAGSGPEEATLKALANESGAEVEFLGPLTQIQLRDEYRRAAKFIHRSETGSLDKVVLEALASGCPVDTSNPALKHLEQETPAYVQNHHALSQLIPHVLDFYTS